MDRLLAWYRVTSSYGAVVALIVANAIPLLGVMFLRWNVWNILILYWLENGIVGLFNVLKMARAEGTATTAGGVTGRNPLPNGAKVALIPFFVVHYGIFWFVHGIFVLTLPTFTQTFAEPLPVPGAFPPGIGVDDPLSGLEPAGATGLEPGVIVLGVLALAISHGLSFWWNFLRRGEYRRVSAQAQMFAPYGRLVALHLTIILGAMAVIATGAPAAAVAILVVAKTVLDLGLHLAEHRRLETATA